MNPRTWAARIAALPLLLGLIAGCGGDGMDLAGGGTGGTGIVQGPISGFGSVIVNGIHFEVDTASLNADGQPITEADLRVGMVVRVSGEIAADGTSGTAVRLDYDDDLKGPVASVDAAGNRFVVLGQTVLVSAATAFDGGSLATLSAGQVVEVSGFFDAAGNLHATFVEVGAGGDDYKLKGIVSGLDASARTFNIGTQVVSYAGAELEDFPERGIEDGQRVEVELAAGFSGGVIAATEVEYKGGGLGATAGQWVELEGLITEFSSSSAFVIGGQAVRTGSRTVYEDGARPDLLGLNVRVEVKGRIAADGVLEASRVELEQNSNVEIVASVEDVDAAAGTVTLLGLPVRVTAGTQYRDQSDQDDRYFSLASVRDGDWLEIDGYIGSDGGFVATRIERDEPDDEVSLRGPVSAIALPGFQLFGVAVTTGVGSRFENRAGAAITQAAFFELIGEGDIVKAEGGWNGAAIAASEVELED